MGNLKDYPKSEYSWAIKRGLSEWNNVLPQKINIRALNIEEKTTFPPFSDLNEQCVYVIDNYLDEEDLNIVTYASTVSVINSSNRNILDSDLLIWDTEIQKLIHYSKEKHSEYSEADLKSEFLLSDKFRSVIAHEFGHFWGLAHNFTLPSIMGYSKMTHKLTEYDENAIKELYKEDIPPKI